MKSGVKLFSVFSLLFFLSFFLYFGLNIKKDFKNTYIKNEQNFAELKLRVMSTYFISSDLKTDYFSKRMHELLNISQNLIAFSIEDKSGTVLYIITKNKSLFDTSKNIPNISESLNPIFYIIFKAPISLSTASNSSIKAVYKSFQVQTIYPLLKDAFFTIIIFLIITFIYLLYLLTAKEEKGSIRFSTSSDKAGIYSPFSGLVWKDHLMPSLENEIESSYAEKSNLTLSIISIDNFEYLSNKEIIYPAIANFLKEIFKNKKLLFEWFSGYAIIMPQTDISTAILRIKNLQKLILNAPEKYGNIKISTGLSARNGRYLDSDTLYREANTALIKAQKERTSSIIAFNADPEKYRAMHS